MFVNAIEKVGDYTRPFIYIARNYGETMVMPHSATMFFVNDEGYAVTTREVAKIILTSQNINAKYAQFKQTIKQFPNDSKRASLIKKQEMLFGYSKGVTVNVKCNFKSCVSPITEITCHVHKNFDVAIVHFKGFDKTHYKGHAVFADNANAVKPGKMLCRVGFPFPEVSGAIYNGITDDIEWGDPNSVNTPRFPTEGMVTRHVGTAGEVTGIELSTAGIKGQNGCPPFDENGVVYGMYIETRRLSMGYAFDEKGMPCNVRDTHPSFVHIAHCLSGDIIKKFLDENGVKYYTESDMV